MKSRVLGAALLAAMSAATVAGAQTAQTAPAQGQQQPQPVLPTRHGTVLPGLCTYNIAQVVGQSIAGGQIDQQSQAFLTAANTEFDSANLETQLAPYEGKPTSEVPAALLTKMTAYRQRIQQIVVTQRQQKSALANAIEFGPLAKAYEERNCSLLLGVEQYQPGYVNPSADMSPTVTQHLNELVPTWPAFQLVPLPPQQQGQ